MTKQEAIEHMKSGGKVRHRSFMSEEWMTQKYHVIYFEDGIQMREWEFWQGRGSKEWEDGYSIVE